jgi:hypothetical protein
MTGAFIREQLRVSGFRREQQGFRLVFSIRTATSIHMRSADMMRSAFLIDLVNFNFVFATVNI